MRHIRIDQARRKKTQKRGGNVQRLELDEVAAPTPDDELLALDEALTQLAALDARDNTIWFYAYAGGARFVRVRGPQVEEGVAVQRRDPRIDRVGVRWIAPTARSGRGDQVGQRGVFGPAAQVHADLVGPPIR